MMPPGIQSEELAIEHVRQRGQRIPLAEWPLGESPPDPLAGQPRGDVRIWIDKAVVVVIERKVAERLAVDQPDRQEQKTAHGPSVVGLGSLPHEIGRTHSILRRLSAGRPGRIDRDAGARTDRCPARRRPMILS